MKDLVYVYDKETLVRNELGELQINFNISNVIDGTKDSTKIDVFSYQEKEIEPFSIIKHQATNTWWVVSHDKVEKIMNEDTYWYKHNLELLGAIELLNGRDFVDSGFNQNRYTIDTFFRRVIKHSNFDLKNNYDIDYNNVIAPNKKIDYVKTYENYTPLSALRDFFNGYNASIKLAFNETTVGTTTTITSARFYLISKTGNVNKAPISESVFNVVNEIKTMDKNSFGTTVISNAQNVISTKTKTFPTRGSVKLSADAYKITYDSAVLRLPSPAYKVNWVKFAKGKVNIIFNTVGSGPLETSSFDPFDNDSIELARQTIRAKVEITNPDLLSWFDSEFNVEGIQDKAFVDIYNEENYDPVNKTFISQNQITNFSYQESVLSPVELRPLFLSSEELRNNIEKNNGGLYYQRGSDKIKGFEFFYRDNVRAIINKLSSFQKFLDGNIYNIYVGYVTYDSDSGTFIDDNTYYIYNCNFIVNYTPMNDIKIKVDNAGTRKDSQLYNQNGKLTDSVALSKSLLSYSKEIESNNITKNGTYYLKYDNGVISHNIPLVGDLVTIGSDLYVINNASMDFYPNESSDDTIEYFVRGEFTLSKNIATKSLMVNPNTNIRDYGIPQNFNVKRKQLYRDFYELTHTQESDNVSWYLSLDKILNVSNLYSPYQEHTAIMELTFVGAYGGTPSEKWYYQLETTTFVMKKAIYEIVDFKDNNIIGYGNQNVWCGFDVQRIFSGMIDDISTPISYVDENGEFKGIDIYFCNNEQIDDIYDGYKTEKDPTDQYDVYLANYSVFIPSDVFGISSNDGTDNNYGAKVNHDFEIKDDTYNKDATEVPVFEYSCQIDDSNDVIVGSNILDGYEEDVAYIYTFAFVDKNMFNDNNYSLAQINKPSISSNNIAMMNNAVKMAYSGGKLTINLYTSQNYNLLTREQTYIGSSVDFDPTKDLMIVRHRILQEDLFYTTYELINVVNQPYANLPTAIADYLGKYAIKTDDKYYRCDKASITPIGTLYNIKNTYYYHETSGTTNLPTRISNSDIGKELIVKYRIDPSNADHDYTLLNTGTLWFYDEITHDTNLDETSPTNNSMVLCNYMTLENYTATYFMDSYTIMPFSMKSTYQGQEGKYNVFKQTVAGVDMFASNVTLSPQTKPTLITYWLGGDNYNETIAEATMDAIVIVDRDYTYTFSSENVSGRESGNPYTKTITVPNGTTRNDITIELRGSTTDTTKYSCYISDITISGTQATIIYGFEILDQSLPQNTMIYARIVVIGRRYANETYHKTMYVSGNKTQVQTTDMGIKLGYEYFAQSVVFTNQTLTYIPPETQVLLFKWENGDWLPATKILPLTSDTGCYYILLDDNHKNSIWKEWNGSEFVASQVTLTNTKKFAKYINVWSFESTNTTTSYYCPIDDTFYKFNGVGGWTKEDYTEEWRIFNADTNVSWEDLGAVDPNDYYEYNGLYYKWESTQWVDNTQYQWIEVANADNQYFTYDNKLYKYNATTNILEQISSGAIERQDLMFIIKNMENADIDDITKTLSLCINHYKIE